MHGHADDSQVKKKKKKNWLWSFISLLYDFAFELTSALLVFSPPINPHRIKSNPASCFFLISLANMSNGLWLVLTLADLEIVSTHFFSLRGWKVQSELCVFSFWHANLTSRCWRWVTNYPCIYMHARGMSTINALLCQQELLHDDVLMTSTWKYWPLLPAVWFHLKLLASGLIEVLSKAALAVTNI